MSKKEILQNGVKQVFYEEEWYPPISEALKNLTAAQACWYPEGTASNTIWKNANHLLIFKERLLSRLHQDDTFVVHKIMMTRLSKVDLMMMKRGNKQ